MAVHDLNVSAEENLTALPPETQEAVQEFAEGLASNFSLAFAAAVNLTAENVTVTCMYRQADPESQDLLTLSALCTPERPQVSPESDSAKDPGGASGH